MTHPLESALNRALSIRLNLQITLSSLPIVEEWMDIHLDRWLEHIPTPPEMPAGHAVSFLAMLGSDLRRMWWGAWGDPAGMVPKLADYLKLCNVAKSDAAVLDRLGEKLEPKLVGPWVGVWGGKVTTGWHFWDPHSWDSVEPLFGTHEAKFKMKKWVADRKLERIERFTQSIGETAFSEFEFAAPGTTVGEQVDALAEGFQHFSGAALPAHVVEMFHSAPDPQFALSVRIRGGEVVRTAAIAPGMPMAMLTELCTTMKTNCDPKLDRLVSALAREGPNRIEVGRAGERGGVDVFVEPTESARPPSKASADEPPPSSQAN